MTHKPTFAERRADLLARCAQQREAARLQAAGTLAPFAQLSGLRRRIGFKVPLAVVGVLIGLALARPRRIVPTLTAAAGLWKLAKNLLDAVRQATPPAAPTPR